MPQYKQISVITVTSFAFITGQHKQKIFIMQKQPTSFIGEACAFIMIMGHQWQVSGKKFP